MGVGESPPSSKRLFSFLRNEILTQTTDCVVCIQTRQETSQTEEKQVLHQENQEERLHQGNLEADPSDKAFPDSRRFCVMVSAAPFKERLTAKTPSK